MDEARDRVNKLRDKIFEVRSHVRLLRVLRMLRLLRILRMLRMLRVL